MFTSNITLVRKAEPNQLLTNEVLDGSNARLGEACSLGDCGIGGLGEGDILDLDGCGLELLILSTLGDSFRNI